MLETQTDAIELALQATRPKLESHSAQLVDIHWKLKEFENRQRRNNLRVLGIAEGVEGSDPRRYVTELFKEAFPDLEG